MTRLNPGWYIVIALTLLLPMGARAVTWKRSRPAPVEAEQARGGEVLFNHEWTVNDPLSKGGDGLGPVFNAKSCVACHKQGGVGGSGGLRHNVTTFVVRDKDRTREGVVHAMAVHSQETLAHVDPTLPSISQPSLQQVVRIANQRNNHCIPLPFNVSLSQRNTPALFGAKLIDDLPERIILAGEKAQRLKWGMATSKNEELPVGRAMRLANGKIGRFGWKAQSASLADFVQAACANELGLGNPGSAQPRPLGNPAYMSPSLDLTREQCDQITAYCASLPHPVVRLPAEPLLPRVKTGKELFAKIGCADCHTPTLGGISDIYSDLLLHRMGQDLVGGGSYNEPPRPLPDAEVGEAPSPGEWRTPPLWGLADSAPYLHDGRASTVEVAITMHAGQGARAAQRFVALPRDEQLEVLEFLKCLKAP